jgi:hypothetical protein
VKPVPTLPTYSSSRPRRTASTSDPSVPARRPCPFV